MVARVAFPGKRWHQPTIFLRTGINQQFGQADRRQDVRRCSDPKEPCRHLQRTVTAAFDPRRRGLRRLRRRSFASYGSVRSL